MKILKVLYRLVQTIISKTCGRNMPYLLWFSQNKAPQFDDNYHSTIYNIYILYNIYITLNHGKFRQIIVLNL